MLIIICKVCCCKNIIFFWKEVISSRLFYTFKRPMTLKGSDMAWFLNIDDTAVWMVLKRQAKGFGERSATHWLSARYIQPCKRTPFTRRKAVFCAPICGLLQHEMPPFARRLNQAPQPCSRRSHVAKTCARVKNIKNLIVLQKFRLNLQLKNTS